MFHVYYGQGLNTSSHISLQYKTPKMFLVPDRYNVQVPVMKPLQVVSVYVCTFAGIEHIVPSLHQLRLVLIQTVSKRRIVLAFICIVDCYLHF